MTYRPQFKSHRSAGRGTQKSPREKAKAKRQKHHSASKYLLDENPVPTSEEVREKTLSRLRSLGNQTFAFSPFSEYFDDWLVNLKNVLNDFEASSSISVDEQFVKERSQILSDIELELEETRRREASLEESFKRLSNNKTILEHIDEEYAARTRELEGRKNSETKRLNNRIDGLRGELDSIAHTKAGIFRPFSKKAKTQKATETTQKLNTAQRELASAIQNFTAEQERLRDEYERKKQPIIEQIEAHQKDVEPLETDGSIEDRRLACEALADAVSSLLRRKMPPLR